jgi:uncharacterized protein YndB with AHSA1/START domain
MSKTLTVDLKRVIAGPPAQVYKAWMDPKKPGGPWNHGKTLALDPKVGKPFYILMRQGVPHFGRFLALAAGKQLKHTWMSPYTRGQETTVTIDFKKHAQGTLLTLKHAGLSNDAYGKAHIEGWGYFLGQMEQRFKAKAR